MAAMDDLGFKLKAEKKEKEQKVKITSSKS
jgi:hypothetical protein